jgi:hypothetical protein
MWSDLFTYYNALSTPLWRRMSSASTYNNVQFQLVASNPWVSNNLHSINLREIYLVDRPLDYRPLTALAIIRPRRDDIAAAVQRARELLIGELNGDQRLEFEEHGHVTFAGRRAKYRIRRARAANVDVLDRRGRVTHRLCAHPVDWALPPEDVMLAQLFFLHDDEDGFLRIANRHPRPGADAQADRHLAWVEERMAAA